MDAGFAAGWNWRQRASRLEQKHVCAQRRPGLRRAARQLIAVTVLDWNSGRPIPEDAETGLPGARFDPEPPVTRKILLDIIEQKVDEAGVNDLLWTLLGWVKTEDGSWDDSAVPVEWKESYPEGPPDFVGNPADFSPRTDRPVKKAVQKLTRSIAAEYKQLLRNDFDEFKGFKIKELTPNKTRRATAVQWLLYYCKSRNIPLL